MDETIHDEADAVAALLALTDPANGDDAAILRAPEGAICVSTDSTIVGVHVPPNATPDQLGRHAVARAASDLAAMGATPVAMTCAIQVPPGEWVAAVDAARAAAQRGCEQRLPLVGGDLTATPGPMALTITVIGASSGTLVTRAGAHAGDVIAVTGSLGRAARAHAAGAPVPEPPDRRADGMCLAHDAHAMIDLSDGLARDAGHVARASGVDLAIDLDLVPICDGVDVVHAVEWGDDYELLVCLPRQSFDTIAPRIGLTSIGQVVEGTGEVRFERAGARVEIADGHVHGRR